LLVGRLDAAERCEREREHWAERERKIATEREAVCSRQERARASLAPILEAAGVETLADLGPVIERSTQRRTLERDLHRDDRALAEVGDGLSFAELEQEVLAQDRATLARDLSEHDARVESITSEIARLAVRQADALRTRDAIAGRDAAATAAQERSAAVAAMTDAADRWARLHVASELLRWALDRFRKEKQGPMLARASELFAKLTLSEMVRLVAEYDDNDRPRLAAIRRNGSSVELDGLSTGTRDQLYLALRLSAVEAQVEVAPMPFVADDLFVHFDDARASAAFEILGALSERTQVLYFTHHDHLVGVARRALGDDLHVVDLRAVRRA
jgi:uncharacterized protein YhaN